MKNAPPTHGHCPRCAALLPLVTHRGTLVVCGHGGGMGDDCSGGYQPPLEFTAMKERDFDLVTYCDKPLVCACHCGNLARMVIVARERAEAAEEDWQVAKDEVTNLKMGRP